MIVRVGSHVGFAIQVPWSKPERLAAFRSRPLAGSHLPTVKITDEGGGAETNAVHAACKTDVEAS